MQFIIVKGNIKKMRNLLDKKQCSTIKIYQNIFDREVGRSNNTTFKNCAPFKYS